MNSTFAVPKSIGIIGLGLVGRALAMRFARGFEQGLLSEKPRLLGYDPAAEACEHFEQLDGQVLASNQAVAQASDLCFIALLNSAIVENVISDVLRSKTIQARYFIDCSTQEPTKIPARATTLARRNIAYLEAPLSGSSEQIAQGTATMLISGDEASYKAIQLLLSCITSSQQYLGGSGLASKAKLATNLVLGLNRAALAEGMVFADNLGIPKDLFLQLVLASPARSDAALVKGQKMVSNDFSPQSRISQHYKDVQLMLEAAKQNGVVLPLSQTHANLLQAAIGAGDGELDNAAIIRQIERGT